MSHIHLQDSKFLNNRQQKEPKWSLQNQIKQIQTKKPTPYHENLPFNQISKSETNPINKDSNFNQLNQILKQQHPIIKLQKHQNLSLKLVISKIYYKKLPNYTN